MTSNLPDRRKFIKQAGVLTAAAALTGLPATAKVNATGNKLPAWKGFNLLDFFSPDPVQHRQTPEAYFKWIADWGFDFIRIPVAYPYYLDFDRSKPIRPEDVYKVDEAAVKKIDALIYTAHKYNLHVSLNLHRAPGYCINAGFHEPYNLWVDQAALDAFCFHWGMWANRYKHIPASKLSFDLLNEPTMRVDMNDQLAKRSAVPSDIYLKVARTAIDTIHKISPERQIIADGNNAGRTMIPGLEDLDIAQSCRGYSPETISHYKAPWVYKHPESLPLPKWPNESKHEGKQLLTAEYQPWIELVNRGGGVHCGECGCWNKTPHEVFMAWFADVLGIFAANKIGFAIWEFDGDFGILNSGRADVVYEDWHGHKLDRKMLQLLQQQMK
ncbi:glycoside hydrolase family 5 protein [Mucilaginibacter sp. SP1R1]|uniref:glycoside hydrolase family 5 protein n=1 Tax=Mucilaginibacter sp. SP1R1 TaxID=2723091 RepID=UPI00160D75A5|nr:cellulase family glycosylhydrolase [Mucilaginibacter sp. SP1R1]MBB6148337.1 aryl-phospho-beta-D-glucosidase BglC (GH1 family) [Mucilaginibacter sp. SP1R1]